MMANARNGAPSAQEDRTVFSVELFISHLLRWGVILSLLIVGIGVLALIASGHTGYDQARLDDLGSLIRYHPGQADFPTTVPEVTKGLARGEPYAIISLGILVLIALPVVRVGVSILVFVVERDWVYVLITAFVLSMLLLSFFLGKAGE
jgi:uncharacterized membrane protein